LGSSFEFEETENAPMFQEFIVSLPEEVRESVAGILLQAQIQI